VLSAAAGNLVPPVAALDELNAELAAAAVPARLLTRDGALRREWLDPTDTLDWYLGPVVRSAADFVVSPDVVRLKECPGGPGKACGFLFLDDTKNRSRRWCSSRTCGNRARQHRFYTRAQD
jgi:predicted RNA-binding Zn ribbon-like protein